MGHMLFWIAALACGGTGSWANVPQADPGKSPPPPPVPQQFRAVMESVVLVEFTIDIDMSPKTGEAGTVPISKKVYGLVLDAAGHILIAGDYGLGDMMVVPGMEENVSTPRAVAVRAHGLDGALPARFLKRDAARDLALVQVKRGAGRLTPIDLGRTRMPRAGETVVIAVGHEPELFWSRVKPKPEEDRRFVRVPLDRSVAAPGGADIFPLPHERRWHIPSEGLPAVSERGELLGVITYVKMPQPENVRRPGFGYYAVLPMKHVPFDRLGAGLPRVQEPRQARGGGHR